ncbi:MAG: hypothetical protein IJ415_00215 [Clostridia bacterium]|nr:hypothetical protein [Clostridia bacterium]
MKFKLIEKTQKEIDAIIEERQFYAKRVSGTPDTEVCPLTVVMGNGQKVDTWALTEQNIIDLINANVKEMTDIGPKDKSGTANSFKILKSWQEKNQTVSADFVSMFYQLRDLHKGAKREVVRDMMTPLVCQTVEQAEKNAKFLKGTRDDFSPVTEKQIIQAIKEQERQLESSKNLNNNQTA